MSQSAEYTMEREEQMIVHYTQDICERGLDRARAHRMQESVTSLISTVLQ